jgi:hypothetical protein
MWGKVVTAGQTAVDDAKLLKQGGEQLAILKEVWRDVQLIADKHTADDQAKLIKTIHKLSGHAVLDQSLKALEETVEVTELVKETSEVRQLLHVFVHDDAESLGSFKEWLDELWSTTAYSFEELDEEQLVWQTRILAQGPSVVMTYRASQHCVL